MSSSLAWSLDPLYVGGKRAKRVVAPYTTNYDAVLALPPSPRRQRRSIEEERAANRKQMQASRKRKREARGNPN